MRRFDGTKEIAMAKQKSLSRLEFELENPVFGREEWETLRILSVRQMPTETDFQVDTYSSRNRSRKVEKIRIQSGGIE